MTRACIIGAGGLGGPIALALAAAGWRLRVVDPDRVELSNLQRQIQFATADIGQPKAAALAALVRARHPGASIEALDTRFEASTADAITAGVDVVLDGTDDPATKFAVGDHAVARGLPCVIAGVLRYGGTVFAGAPDAACYRCLFEDPPGADQAPSCADAGVLGAACAVIGGLAARAALGLALDQRGAGTITVVEDLRRGCRPRTIPFDPRPGCACGAARVHRTASTR
ncbi:MAG: ThiF family adenylyltransferase [Deltaproteobacteria bacterium]|nr:ThiF family adenylyltransferase [Deltaproteobacteria bacterium]